MTSPSKLAAMFGQKIDDLGGGLFDGAPRDINRWQIVACIQALGEDQLILDGGLVDIVGRTVFIEVQQAVPADLDDALGGGVKPDNDRLFSD